MNYEELFKNTDELVRRTLIHNAIGEWIIVVALLASLIFVTILVISEHREKMRLMKARKERLEAERIAIEKNERGVWSANYVPNVTNDVETVDGVTWRRMGPVRKK